MKPWSEMSPRERDALVAEKVMGWTPNGLGFDTTTGFRTLEMSSFGSFQPSRDIAAAWEVVLMLEKMGWDVIISPGSNLGGAWCELQSMDERHVARADTAPEAICLAALKAMGVEV